MKFTIVSTKQPIGKKFSLDDQTGTLQKNDGGNLTMATFNTCADFDMVEMLEFFVECDERAIIIPGTSEYHNGFILTKADLKRRENEEIAQHKIARSKDYFKYRGGEGFLLLDYDPSSDYAQNNGEPLSKEDLLNILYEVLPEIKECSHLWKTSSSSCIENLETDEVLRGILGQHIFVQIKNTMDIERVVDVFYKRLWLHGHGYIFVDKTGGMHNRTIIDRVVNSPEREIFLKADCMHPVFQQVQYDVIGNDRGALNTESISDLTIDEEERFKNLVKNARDKRAGLALSVRNDYVDKNYEKFGLTRSKLNNSIEDKVLYDDHPLKLQSGVMVTVGEVKADKDKYDGLYLHDPLEPEYGGLSGSSTKAWLDLYNSRIHGHAHGGISYLLVDGDRKGPHELALEICDLKDHRVMFRKAAVQCLEMRYVQTEIDQFISFLSKSAGMKKVSCEKAFKAEYHRNKGSDDKAGSVDVDSDQDALENDGSFRPDMIQENISNPISLQFPHTFMRGDVRMNMDTVENFEFMTKAYGIDFQYDQILKIPTIGFPKNVVPDGDNKMNASLSRLKSLCVLNGLGKDSVNYVAEMVNGNQKNPVLDWINRAKWDGNSRVELVCNSMVIADYGNSDDDQVNKDFSTAYKHKVMRMWFLQCIAALDGSRRSPLSTKQGSAVPKYEYILVFAGQQGVQKTKFIKSLLPNELKQYILTGHELDTKDKDNIKIAISHWITELGEIDSTFKKSDISSLKAFMSKEDDQIRMPYAASESKFVRRTSFCGSVNDIMFLVDKTGNRRYLPIEVLALNPFYNIDIPKSVDDEGINDNENGDGDLGFVEPVKMSDPEQTQQFWAEVMHYYLAGEQWWPDMELERMLDVVIKGHERVDPIIEALDEKFDFVRNDEWSKKNKSKGAEGISELNEALSFAYLNVSEVCNEIGFRGEDPRITNIVSNYIKKNGISLKKRRENRNSSPRKCFRICLNRGVSLNSCFITPSNAK